MTDGAERSAAAPRRAAPWFAAYGVATFLSFPHHLAGSVIDLGVFAAWLGPAALLVALDGLSPRAAVGRTLLVATLTHAAVFHWIYVVTVTYGHAPPIVGVIAPLALALYPAIFIAGFAWAQRRFASARLSNPFIVATLWTAFESLRFFAFTGFPWAIVGYAQHRNAALLPIASLTGVHGLSFATALGGAALARGFLQWRRAERPDRAVIAAIAAVVALHGVGLALRPATFDDAPGPVVAGVQGNIDQGVKWSADWAGRTLDIYEELTLEATGRGAAVVVWPETAVPGALEASPSIRRRLSRLADETGATLVVGGVGAELDPSTGRLRRVFDSAFVFDADGDVTTRYDKTHLVPFGEYVPFRDLLGRFIGAVARGVAATDVSAGERPRAVVLSGPDPASEDVRVGVPICYELLFPDLVRQFARDGGTMLLAITNDAWYGRTGAPHQFLAITVLRSVETGLWTVRAANSGVSAVIDPRGRVREATAIFERGSVQGRIPQRPEELGPTFYVRAGNWVVFACWIALALLARVAVRKASADSTT